MLVRGSSMGWVGVGVGQRLARPGGNTRPRLESRDARRQIQGTRSRPSACTDRSGLTCGPQAACPGLLGDV